MCLIRLSAAAKAPNENPYEVTLVIEPEDNDKNKGDDNNDDSDNKEKT